MYILDSFWNGRPAGYERMTRDNSEYKKIAYQSLELAEEIDAALPAEGREIFERYQSLQVDLSEISAQDSFVRGVRLGAQFILDVVGEYRSQLPFHGELQAEE